MTHIDMPDIIELKSLKGYFLAASPAMNDPRFSESLVLVAQHDETGAVGFIVNQPIESLTLYSLLDQLDIENPKGVTDHFVINGGPVRTNNGFLIFEGGLGLRDEKQICERVFFSSSLDGLKLIPQGRGPEKYLICLGRAEWAPGQLEEELKENVWLPTPASSDVVFAEDVGETWMHVLKGQGIEPSNFSIAAGHA